jgi:hypothetical protein
MLVDLYMRVRNANRPTELGKNGIAVRELEVGDLPKGLVVTVVVGGADDKGFGLFLEDSMARVVDDD